MPSRSLNRRRKPHDEKGQQGRDWDRFEKGNPTRDFSWSRERYLLEDTDYTRDPSLQQSPFTAGPENTGIPAMGNDDEAFIDGAAEAVLEDFAEGLQGSVGDQAESNGLDSLDLSGGPNAAAAAFVAHDCTYPLAAARYREVTGIELPPGIYEKVAAQADKTFLIREAVFPRWSCADCGSVYATRELQDVDVSCPSCGGYRVARHKPKRRGEMGPQETERLYRRDYEVLNIDHGNEPLRYDQTASFEPVADDNVGVGDTLRNCITGEQIYVEAIDEVSIRGQDLMTQRARCILPPERGFWEKTGFLVE